MALLLKKIKATTLVETLVSMTLLSLVAGFAVVIFLQVSSPASSSRSMILAQQHSAEMLDTLSTAFLEKRQNTVIKDIADNIYYYEIIEAYTRGLAQVTIEARSNNDQLIYTRKRIYYLHEAKQ